MKNKTTDIGKPLSDTSDENKRMLYYDFLHFIPVENKNERWAAEVLYYNTKNSKIFQIPSDLAKKRSRDKNEIDEIEYKKRIDPTKGKAEYFSSDWKGNPIFLHLNNIIDAKIEKVPRNLQVKATDEFSKSNQQKENERILGQNEFREFINDMNARLGFPPLKPNEDPFKYVERIQKSAEEGGGAPVDMPVGLIDSIKSAIEDNDDLALFNEFLYKDGVEIACELGIHHYLFVVNKFMEYSEQILSDIRLTNKCVMRWYTSLTTGMPVIKYMSPDKVYTDEFSKADGSDITFWYNLEDITFGDFVRMVGADLDADQLKAAFDRNRQIHGYYNYDRLTPGARNNAKMKIGYMEFESQDLEVYSNFVSRGNNKFKKETSDWYPSSKQVRKYGATREERNYNVWRSFIFIPPNTMGVQGTADFDDQAKFIYKFKKVQDQQRYGDDWRYAKNGLILVTSPTDKPSFFDIVDSFMPQIHLLWLKVKNDFVQASPAGVIWAKSFLEAGMKNIDAGEDKPAEVMAEMMSQILQTGSGISDVVDKDGNPVPGALPFTPMETKHIDEAVKKMNAIMLLYQMLTRSLGISETAEGQDPKPRQSLGGIETAAEGTANSTYYVEKQFSKVIVQAGERIMNYLNMIVDDKDTARLKEFQDVVGKANGMAFESIKDIPKHKLGLSVQDIMTDAQRQQLNMVANQMAGAGVLDPATALYLTTVDNLKYAIAILKLESKKKRKEIQDQQDRQNQALAQQSQANQQFEMAKIQANWQLQEHMRVTLAQMDAQMLQMENQMKQQGQLEVKQTIKENKIEEAVANKQLEQGQPV